MRASLFASAVLVLVLATPAIGQSVPRPENWNFMNAAQQASWLCRYDPARALTPCVQAAEPQRPSYKNLPANWNWMNGVDQARWLAGEAMTPRPQIAAPSQYTHVPVCTAAGCVSVPNPNYAFTQPPDFEATRQYLERVRRAAVEVETNAQQRRGRPGMSLYSDSNGVTGSSVSLPPFEFYNFSNGVSGTATTLRPFTFYDFTNSRGKTTTGTSTTIGQFDFHNFSNGVSGTSTTIGGTTFHNFSNGKTCTTQTIGASTFTNCY